MKRRTVESSRLRIKRDITFPRLQSGVNSRAAHLSITRTSDGWLIEKGQDIILDPPVHYLTGRDAEIITWLERLLRKLSGTSYLDHPAIPPDYMSLNRDERDECVRAAILQELEGDPAHADQ